jgi:hypothetical protein
LSSDVVVEVDRMAKLPNVPADYVISACMDLKVTIGQFMCLHLIPSTDCDSKKDCSEILILHDLDVFRRFRRHRSPIAVRYG